jgi:photosystem II stability/assembly factor-like uncharacterized protein
MMDRLRKDLRTVFSRQQAPLGDLAGARQRLIAGALRQRDEPVGGRLQFAAGIVAVVLAVVIVATFVYMRAGQGVHPEGPSPVVSPKASPSPIAIKTPGPAAGFATVDAYPLSASTGWLLITNCIQPMTGKCHYSVTHTADGGRTWSKAVQVGPSYDPTNGDAPRSVRFISVSDGFVYGGAELFATHDGGRIWGPVALHPVYFVSATGQGAKAWAVTYPCAKGVVCPYEVRSSLDAGRKWSSPFSIPVGFNPLAVLTIGSNGVVISGEPSGDMEITLDGGASWRFVKSPCVGNAYRGIVATADGNELWELCLEYPNSQMVANERLFVSEDGGGSWGLRARSQVNGSQIQDDYSTSLVSPRTGTALMASVRSTIKISHDGGRTWSQAGPDGGLFISIRFANPTDGWALDISKNIWITTDAGDRWTQAGT